MYKEYLEFFGVTQENLQEIISIALSKGGDYADIYMEYSIINELMLRDGEVNTAGTHIDYGVGIRVVSNDKTGYAYSEITSMEEMKKAALTAAQIANENNSYIPPVKVNILKGNNFYPIEKGWDDVNISYKVPYLEHLNNIIFSLEKKVVKVIGKITDSSSKILFFNSNYEGYADLRPMISVTATCVMESKGRVESAGASRSFRKGFEFLTNEMIEDLAKECVQKTSFLFTASQPKGGMMDVVMGAGSSGILLHEAVGHAFEADFNRKGTSIFSDCMGKKICNESINIIDDGTITGNRGSCNWDDEGVPGQKTYMVKDGVLNSYLHDRISAKFYGVNPTGNGRRECFRFMPIPRMRATYMESGKAKEVDLISQIKKGIYVDNFSNGQVQIGAGDFTFYVKSGYLIENGKLTQPIKDVNIIGNGPEALKNITEVADNGRIEDSTWTCGKGQYCPVSCGMPSVLVKNLTVGGMS
ncbi:MAG: TldD/PmbA family protein [Bacteroidales bacterium]|nr:TldD/PmbA family protein [Bacteroidales bacterium]